MEAQTSDKDRTLATIFIPPFLSPFMAKQLNSNAPTQRLDLSLSQVQLGAAEIDLASTTPRTPADEGKEFFLSKRSEGEDPIRVYELKLDPDGGPSKQRSVSYWVVRFDYPLTRHPTVYPSSPCLYPIHLTRLLGCGNTRIEKWCIHNKLPPRWWLIRARQVRRAKVSAVLMTSRLSLSRIQTTRRLLQTHTSRSPHIPCWRVHLLG